MSLRGEEEGRYAPHHLCKCGQYATRNEFGELVCDTCLQYTNRALKHRSEVLKISYAQETQDADRRARRIAGIRASKTMWSNGQEVP
jgi:hypothetical protein